MKRRIGLLFLLSIALTVASAKLDPHAFPVALQQPTTCYQHEQPQPLPSTLNIIVWNAAKSDHARYDEMLNTSDLALLQEALVNDFALSAEAYHGSGVALQGISEPISSCFWLSYEPILLSPKASLVAEYDIESSAEHLFVATLHGVNFDWSQEVWKAQIDRLLATVKNHRGPILMGGDFNTWSETRMNYVLEQSRRLGLALVDFAPDIRLAPFGYPLDLVLIRDLEVTYANTFNSALSDHAVLRLEVTIVATPSSQ